MKRLTASFLMILSVGMANAATPFETCVNSWAPAFTQTLNKPGVTFDATNITNLLQPQFDNIIQTDPNCIQAKSDLLKHSGAEFAINIPGKPGIDITVEITGDRTSPETSLEFESVMPWYGIMVVKKGSLDEYVKKDLPVIPTEYMKNNRKVFYPDNSDKPLGMWKGCTHSNHTAHDKDVINQAAHVTFGEEDSFWRGNDYYVYDGKDVYWGTAALIGEVALTIVTFGVGAGVSAGKATAQATAAAAKVQTAARVGRAGTAAISAVNKTKFAANTPKIAEAAKVAKAVKAGDKASKAAAVAKLEEIGVTVARPNNAKYIAEVGKALETHASASAISATRVGLGTAISTAWKSGFLGTWKLTKSGATAIRPKTIVAATPGIKNLKGIKKGLAIGAVGAAEGGIMLALAKAYGYSASSIELAKDVKFSGFGLLSADDLEGRENEVSHGAWIMVNDVNDDDETSLDEAKRFAQELKDDIVSFNNNGMCDIDIYVVQVAISNPQKMGKREAYYWLWSTPVEYQLRVDGNAK